MVENTILAEPPGITAAQRMYDRWQHRRTKSPTELLAGSDIGPPQQYAVFAHGGAGAPNETVYNLRMGGTDAAARMGEQMIASGMFSPLDVATLMVAGMEYDIHLIAGLGSGPNKKDTYQFDAFTMTPENMGVVTAIGMVKNPVFAARLVYDSSFPHEIITGPDATDFGIDNGLPRYLKQEMKAGYKAGAEYKHGIYEPSSDTVGAMVAAKWNGRWQIAAAGSTGGMPDKEAGRVGDCGAPGTGFWVAQEPEKHSIYDSFSIVTGALISGIGEATIKNMTAYDWTNMVFRSPLAAVAGDIMLMNRIINTNIKGKQGWGGFAGLYIADYNLKSKSITDKNVARINIATSSPFFAVSAYTNIPSMTLDTVRVTGNLHPDRYPRSIVTLGSSLS